MDWNNDIINKKQALVMDVDIGENRTIPQILRVAIDAENEAINLYERIISNIDDKDIKKVFDDIIKEEKTHVGEFQELLLGIDKEQKQELEEGKKEVNDLIG